MVSKGTKGVLRRRRKSSKNDHKWTPNRHFIRCHRRRLLFLLLNSKLSTNIFFTTHHKVTVNGNVINKISRKYWQTKTLFYRNELCMRNKIYWWANHLSVINVKAFLFHKMCFFVCVFGSPWLRTQTINSPMCCIYELNFTILFYL